LKLVQLRLLGAIQLIDPEAVRASTPSQPEPVERLKPDGDSATGAGTLPGTVRTAGRRYGDRIVARLRHHTAGLVRLGRQLQGYMLDPDELAETIEAEGIDRSVDALAMLGPGAALDMLAAEGLAQQRGDPEVVVVIREVFDGLRDELDRERAA
jgi:hypothetical protein